MSYFKDVKEGDLVFGLIFGLGRVVSIFEDGHYKLMVQFEDDYEIPYTDEGVPGWGRFVIQTLFYKEDIDLTEYDFSSLNKVLSPKKIIKLREKKKLEVRLPSGVWFKNKSSLKDYVDDLLKDEKYHLFRKAQA